jgi:hypothetical protein
MCFVRLTISGVLLSVVLNQMFARAVSGKLPESGTRRAGPVDGIGFAGMTCLKKGEKVKMARASDERSGMYGYYIICKRHSSKKDYALNFWGPNRRGYTFDINQAGVYSQEETAEFPEDHYRDDQPVPVMLIEKLSEYSVIDHATLGKIVRNTKKNRSAVGMKLAEMRGKETIWGSGAFCDPKHFLMSHKKTVNILNMIKALGLA